jgi:AcrR family transcriptional regulator
MLGMAPVTAPRIQSADARLPRDGLPPGTAGRILEVGLVLFARQGFHGASIRDIGRELGLKPANLYDHFPSKEHLLAELVRLGHDVHFSMLRRALVDAKGGPIQQLAALVAAHVRMHAEYAMLAVVANNEMHALSPERVAPALALRQQSEGLLMDVVVRGLDERLFDTPDAWLACAAIGGMGIRVAHWYRPSAGLSIDQLADAYVEFALRIVGARPRRRS